MTSGGWKILVLGVVVAFGLLLFVDFLFALAGVSFLIEWFTVEQLSSESARASAITAAVGLIGGVGALITFLFNYQQKQEQFENSQDLSRKQHEYEVIFREYSELSRDFTSDHELSRINAAINLVRIAKLPDPRFNEQRSGREEDSSWILEKYPWFKSTCLQMATALTTYKKDSELNAIRRLNYELIEFARTKKVDYSGRRMSDRTYSWYQRPLLEFLLSSVSESNFQCYKFIEDNLRKYSNNIYAKEDQLRLFRSCESLIGDELRNCLFSELIDASFYEIFSREESRNHGIPEFVVTTAEIKCRQLICTQNIIKKVFECTGFDDFGYRFQEENLSCSYSKIKLCLIGISLENAELSGIEFVDSMFFDLRLKNSICVGMVINSSKLVKTEFSNSKMKFSRFENVVLKNVNFSTSDLGHSGFVHVKGGPLEFRKCNLCNSSLSDLDNWKELGLRLNSNWGKAAFFVNRYESELKNSGHTCYNLELIKDFRQTFPYEGMDEDLTLKIDKSELNSILSEPVSVPIKPRHKSFGKSTED